MASANITADCPDAFANGIEAAARWHEAQSDRLFGEAFTECNGLKQLEALQHRRHAASIRALRWEAAD
jgi:hypothetical protein